MLKWSVLTAITIAYLWMCYASEANTVFSRCGKRPRLNGTPAMGLNGFVERKSVYSSHPAVNSLASTVSNLENGRDDHYEVVLRPKKVSSKTTATLRSKTSMTSR